MVEIPVQIKDISVVSSEQFTWGNASCWVWKPVLFHNAVPPYSVQWTDLKYRNGSNPGERLIGIIHERVYLKQ